MTLEIIGLIVTLLLSAFFSGMEIAFVSSNRLVAEIDPSRNALSQRVIGYFYKHPNNFVSTMLVGNNIALVVYGILFATICDKLLFGSLTDGERVAADTILSTVVVLFTGEFLPKYIFKSNANALLSFFALPVMACYIVLYPISRFSTFLSKILLLIFRIDIENNNNDKGFTKVDLDYLVQTSIDNAKDDEDIEDEVKIFQNALDFADTKVRDCMVPRTEVEAVDIESCTVEELLNRFIESGFSKIIVYKDDIDHVVGYIHSSDLFRNPEKWKESVRQLPYVPETMSASKLMHNFLQQKKSIGVVVDEFGGTSGIVCLEDMVEEIFGEIEDEHDTNQYVAKQIGTDEYLLSARLEIEKANDLLMLELPESDEYITVGGLILHEYQSIPKLNEKVTIGRYEFQIIKSTRTKIELVKLKVSK